MAQHDYDIANADGATVRADLNSLFEAIATMNSGATAPSTTFASQLWWDTANNLLKQRNGTNTGWVTVAAWNGTTFTPYSGGSAIPDALPLAGGTMTGAITLADYALIRALLKDYSETVNAIGSIGGGTQDIDLESGNVITATVDTSETTFTFSNPPSDGSPSTTVAGSFTLILTNGGSQTVNWPASVDWAGGTPPTLTASGVDVLTFVTIDGGATWYGFAAGLAMA